VDLNCLLYIHNTNTIVTVVLLIGLALFTFLNGKKIIQNILMSTVFVLAAILSVVHLVGVNISDPIVSRNILMINAVVFLIGAIQVHVVLAYTNVHREKQNFLIFLYSAAAFFTIFFLINPEMMLLASTPKMYFINYYVPGALNILRIIFLLGICIPYSLYIIYKAAKESDEPLKKKQYHYFMGTLIAGYIFAHIPNFLVFDIKIDPLFGMAFGIAVIIPYVLGAIRYELFNVRVIAKQGFFYAIAVVVIGGFITLLNYTDQLLRDEFATFPVWTIPLLSSVIVTTVGVFVWRNLRESDVLKGEFISVVTHKFRTPLTHIKWSSENIAKMNINDEEKEQIRYIQSANEKLVELTDLLVNVSTTEKNEYMYKYEKVDLTALAKETVETVSSQFESKKFQIKTDFVPDLLVDVDPPRIKFIMQTFIENAIHYTSENSFIEIGCIEKDEHAVFSVKDNGIGVSKDELPLLFKKFYRGHQAKLSDTEGMGIALFMSKEIIERHNGKIWAESQGPNMGSTFAFYIPLLKR